jgi:hypothetical protein
VHTCNNVRVPGGIAKSDSIPIFVVETARIAQFACIEIYIFFFYMFCVSLTNLITLSNVEYKVPGGIARGENGIRYPNVTDPSKYTISLLKRPELHNSPVLKYTFFFLHVLRFINKFNYIKINISLTNQNAASLSNMHPLPGVVDISFSFLPPCFIRIVDI